MQQLNIIGKKYTIVIPWTQIMIVQLINIKKAHLKVKTCKNVYIFS